MREKPTNAENNGMANKLTIKKETLWFWVMMLFNLVVIFVLDFLGMKTSIVIYYVGMVSGIIYGEYKKRFREDDESK